MTVVRVRGATTDAYGDTTEGENRATIPGAFVAPGSTNDVNARGRDGIVQGLSLFAPYGADVLRTDAIEADDVPYRIVGEISPWLNPLTGWEAGITCALERGAG